MFHEKWVNTRMINKDHNPEYANRLYLLLYNIVLL